MKIFTMGFTQKNAENFFEKIRCNDIEIVIDVRLNNQSQLSGFTKGKDLEFFLREICNCKYEHMINFAPTKEILRDYKAKKIGWEEYKILYNKLMINRNVADEFMKRYFNYLKVLLLCSEPMPDKCHRRLLGEHLQKEFNFEITHI